MCHKMALCRVLALGLLLAAAVGAEDVAAGPRGITTAQTDDAVAEKKPSFSEQVRSAASTTTITTT